MNVVFVSLLINKVLIYKTRALSMMLFPESYLTIIRTCLSVELIDGL